MEENKFEVITLLSSDEDSNSQVNTAEVSSKSLKSTARKSMQSYYRVKSVPVMKKASGPFVLNSAAVQENNENRMDVNSLKSGVKGNFLTKNTTARKSMKSHLVSNLKDSLNSQSRPTASKQISKSKLMPNPVGCGIKLPELTITPLQASSSANNAAKSTMPVPSNSSARHFVSSLRSKLNSNMVAENKLKCKSALSQSMIKNSDLLVNEKFQHSNISDKTSVTKSVPVVVPGSVMHVSCQNIIETFKTNDLRSNIPMKKFENALPSSSKSYTKKSGLTMPRSLISRADVRNTDFDQMVAREKDPTWIGNKVSKPSNLISSRRDFVKNSLNVRKQSSEQLFNSCKGKTNPSVTSRSNSGASDIIITKIVQGGNSEVKNISNRKRLRTDDSTKPKLVLHVPFHKNHLNGSHRVHLASSKDLSNKSSEIALKKIVSNKCSSVGIEGVNIPILSDDAIHRIISNRRPITSNDVCINTASTALSSYKSIKNPKSDQSLKFSNKALTIVPLPSIEKQEKPAIPLKYKESFHSETINSKLIKGEQVVHKLLGKKNIDLVIEKSMTDNNVKQPILKAINDEAIEPSNNSNDSNSSASRPSIIDTHLKLSSLILAENKEQLTLILDENKEQIPLIPAENKEQILTSHISQIEPVEKCSSVQTGPVFNNDEIKVKVSNDKDILMINNSKSNLPMPSTSTELVVQENKERIAALKKSLQEITSQCIPSTTNVDIFCSAVESEASNSRSSFPKLNSEISVAINSLVSGESEVTHKEASSSASSLLPQTFNGVNESNQQAVYSLPWKSLNEAMDTDEPDHKNPLKQVTSPKLSLKRKRTEIINNHEKKIKLESMVSNKAIPLPYSTLEAAALTDQNNAIPLPYTTLETTGMKRTTPSSLPNSTSLPWSSSDDNTTKYKKLVDYSKSFMMATEKEKKQIYKNMLKPFNRADPIFVNKLEFSNLMELTLGKIIQTPEDIYVHLQNLKAELDAHKQTDFDSFPRKRCLSISSDQSESMKSTTDQKEKVTANDLEPRPFSVFKPTLNSESESSQMAVDKNEIGISCVHSPSERTSGLKDQLMSALNLVTSNVKSEILSTVKPKELQFTDVLMTVKSADENLATIKPKEVNFLDVPSTSKQADLIEKYLSVPESCQTLSIDKVKSPQSHFVSTQSTKKSDGSKLKNMNDVDDKLESKVQMLERHLGKLDKKIKKLQTKELTLDDLDDDDSSYLLEDRYKRKFAKLWKTLCKWKKRSSLVGFEVERRFNYEGSRYDSINRAVEKMINKRKPSEKFPNYSEVLNLIRKVNEESHLGLNILQEEKTARETFTDIGQELKSRRERDFERDFGCYLTDNVKPEDDPAERDEALRSKLSFSIVSGEKKIGEIIDKYADQQLDELGNADAAGEETEESADEEENEAEMEDLPDTDPATPSTDGPENDEQPPTVPNSPQENCINLIEIGSSDASSTDPNSNEGNSQVIFSEKTTTNAINSNPSTIETKKDIFSNPVFISDEIEIVEGSDSDSLGLPSLSDLVA